MRLCCWYYCSPVVGLLLLSGDEIIDGSGIQIGQRDGESAEDGVVSNSVNNPFVLPLYGRCYFTGGGEAIGWWLIFELLDEEVQQTTILCHLRCLRVPHPPKLCCLGFSGLGCVSPKTPAKQRVAPPGLIPLHEVGSSLVMLRKGTFCLRSAGTRWW